ncbi:DUF6966 domain-containing protein [Occallatibacter riparius]|uniref:Uncharacterized protein n=1 Tax=Occallatibacter riparius TaxID=1002689 RepID=A0A9J7BMU8_9BACT|nr:hypothetical protein [Occallatibacter riparius]UWZ83825.1 hypothetical protein MOP44_25095 [Occallatibacter riparius]
MLNDYKIALLLARIAHELESYAALEDRSHRVHSKPDFIEVGRTAFELVNRHGRNACRYAANLAAEALSEGKSDEAAFWKAVAEHLQPRGSQVAGVSIAPIEPRGFSSDPEGQCQEPDYVTGWCRILMRYAEMFESESKELTAQHRQELHRMIFGGMGSFSDFQLDVRIFGDRAREANERLQVLRTELDSVFRVSMIAEEKPKL